MGRALRSDPYIMGAFNSSALVTVVERRSRFLLLGDLPEGHDAQAVYACLIELTADLPDGLRRSLTWDQGREMANWAQLQSDADITCSSATRTRRGSARRTST
ncbi:MAG: hypothetical protein ACRD1K_17705 [Acidimicrobiales bacterium]